MRSIIIATLLLAGCHISGKKDHQPSPPLSPSADLTTRLNLYLSLQDSVDGPSGFIETDDCDSIHWTALRGVGRLVQANLEAAVEDNGKVHRRPLQLDECYPKHSESTISREAILYATIHSVYFKDLDLLNRIWDYGKSHAWVMGDGVPSRTLFTPAAQAELARAIRFLGGAEHLQVNFPILRPSGLVDFEAFIAVMGVLLEGQIDGAISDESVALLKEQAARQPDNVVYAAMAARWAGGNLEVAERLLLSNPQYTADGLPTSANYCSPWLAQNDAATTGALPCPDQGKRHSAGDWLLAYRIATGDL